MPQLNDMSLDDMIQEICVRVAQNIVRDTVIFQGSEDAAEFQVLQLRSSGLSQQMATGIVILAMQSVTSSLRKGETDGNQTA